jgi:hypothetical protein
VIANRHRDHQPVDAQLIDQSQRQASMGPGRINARVTSEPAESRQEPLSFA